MAKSNYGSGSLRVRGKLYWIRYYKDGVRHEEPTGTWKKTEAQALLNKRLAAPARVKTGILVGELLDDLVVDYQNRNKDAAWGARIAGYLRPAWENRKADKVTTAAIQEYIAERKEAGLGPASINRELSILRRALNLGKESTPPKVGFVPKIRMLKEPLARQGFLDYDQYQTLLEALPEELRVPFVIGYHTGARKEEVLGIRLDWVDLKAGEIRLYDAKLHPEGRWLPVYEEMLKAVEVQMEMTARDYPNCPWLCHRQGERICDMRPAWPDACEAVGLPDLLFHDLRRSAVRNMVRAGIPEKVAMEISGHKTRSVFERYNIVDGRDIKDAGKKLAEYLRGQA